MVKLSLNCKVLPVKIATVKCQSSEEHAAVKLCKTSFEFLILEFIYIVLSAERFIYILGNNILAYSERDCKFRFEYFGEENTKIQSL